MPDPGYGPNGELLASPGLVVWEANSPPVIVIDDIFWEFQPLAVVPLPFIDLDDEQVFQYVNPGVP